MVSRAPLAKKLGRYELVKHLAQGGMADVLLARTTGFEGFERHVVLKRIREDALGDDRYVSMFLDEARLAASLHHHNIVQVTDIGQEDGEYFFTMEYIHGEDARALLAKVSKLGEQVPLEHAIGIVCAAAAGLHHAHDQRGPDRAPLQLVHRDVSPANIMIGYDGGVKIADFGIAKAAHRTTETRSGTLKGKVAYMSPEQCVGEAVDRRSDVFALGIVLYELLTVRRLFKADNDFMTMTAIVLGYIPPPSNFRPDLPPELEDIILKALANKPSDRYQSAQELRLALEHMAAKLQLPILNTSLADYMKQVFGVRPEPWLDDDEPEIEIGVDFDGSASGIVRAPVEAMPQIETAKLSAQGTRPMSMPLPPNGTIEPSLHALRRARRELEIVEDADPIEGDFDGPPIVRTVTPLPIEAEPPVSIEAIAVECTVTLPRRRGRLVLGTMFAIASVCAFAAALWLSRARPAIEPDAAQRTPPSAVGFEPARPIANPAIEKPAIVETKPVDAKPSKPKPAKAKPGSKPSVPQPRSKRWDPNSLFLE
ncbi:MAG: serine/threonine protein kinase [Deltaproteobacteria bacterium]|nr:serine/threonine protein kinase [Deltaproteobacteria bacterium]